MGSRPLGVMIGAMAVAGALLACVGDDPVVVVHGGTDARTDGVANDGQPPMDGAAIDDAASDGADAALPPCATAAVGMIASWTGDNGYADEEGTYPLTSAAWSDGGTATFAPAKVGNGFDLQNAYASHLIPDAGAIVFSALTVEGWVLSRNNGGAAVSGNYQGSTKWRLNFPTVSTVGFMLGGALVSANAPVTGTWMHLAGTWDGATTRLFIDGAAVGTPGVASTPLTVSFFQLGLGTDTGPFAGILDEIAIYGRALSAVEIAAIVAAGPSGRCR